MPVLAGRLRRSWVNASNPPAEAPMPTTVNDLVLEGLFSGDFADVIFFAFGFFAGDDLGVIFEDISRFFTGNSPANFLTGGAEADGGFFSLSLSP
jgi:hypothetical protein